MDLKEIQTKKCFIRDLMIEELLDYAPYIDMDYLVTLEFEKILDIWKRYLFIYQKI